MNASPEGTTGIKPEHKIQNSTSIEKPARQNLIRHLEANEVEYDEQYLWD